MQTPQHDIAERILDQALELGEASSWDGLRLHAVAQALDISLDELRSHYPQKDDLVEAWFDRADRAVLEQKASPAFLALSTRERLQQVILTWLDTLAAHRRLTRAMLAYKLEPGHVHLQALGVMRVSRTVQWFLEAAQADARGMERICQESTLSALYLATFARWLYDESPQSRNTRAFLDAGLRRCETFGGRLQRLIKRLRGETAPPARPLARVGGSD